MSKQCHGCGHVNEDDRIFCSVCGDPLDAELRLVMELDNRTKPAAAPRQTRKDDGDDYVPPVRTQAKKKEGGKTWLIVLAAVAAVVLWMMVK